MHDVMTMTIGSALLIGFDLLQGGKINVTIARTIDNTSLLWCDLTPGWESYYFRIVSREAMN